MNRFPKRFIRPTLLGAAAGGLIILISGGMFLATQQKNKNFNPIRVLGPLPTITQFPTKPVKQASTLLNPSELVIGVTVGNASRAYPINMLTGPQREILNDTLGGKAIAVTW